MVAHSSVCSVERDLVTPKLAYFLLFASYACSMPFFPVIYDQWAITETHIGLIIGFTTLARTLSSLIFGFVSDRLSDRRVVVVACFSVQAVVRAFLPFIVSRIPPENTTVCVALVMTLSSAIGGCVSVLLDNLTTLRLGPSRLPQFGQQRLWGAVSWGIFSLVAGALIDRFGSSLAFYLTVGVGVFLIVTMKFWEMGLNDQPQVQQLDTADLTDFSELNGGEEDSEGPHARLSPLHNWSIHDMWFLIIVFANAVCYGAVGTMLFVFLSGMDGSHLLMGLSLTFTCVSEIPFMFFSGSITRLCGTHGVMLICLLSYGMRFTWYALMARYGWSPYTVLLSEPLHGITFGCFFTAMIHHATSLAPGKSSGTVKGIFSGANALGQAIGGFLCGALAQKMHFENVWTYFGLFGCSVFFIHGLYLGAQRFKGFMGTDSRLTASDA